MHDVPCQMSRTAQRLLTVVLPAIVDFFDFDVNVAAQHISFAYTDQVHAVCTVILCRSR